jgi:RNA polymerase sigma factor (sigma-70 family)
MKEDSAAQMAMPCATDEAVVSLGAKGRSRVLHSDSKSQMVANDAERGSELDKLYRHHRDSVLRYTLRTFGAGPPDPSDVVQAAFEKFVGMENRTDIANPRAFLIASARNYVFDQRRRFKVRIDYAEDVRSTGGETDDFDPERVLVAKEQWRLLERAIQGMDDRRREVLIMNRLHGLSSAEIARRMGCSATLVKMLLAQALVLCQRALKEELE